MLPEQKRKWGFTRIEIEGMGPTQGSESDALMLCGPDPRLVDTLKPA